MQEKGYGKPYPYTANRFLVAMGEVPTMSKWRWALVLVIQAHFAASYVAPTQPHLGPHLGLFNYVWPWAVGDRGILGVHPNLLGIALAGSAGLASLLAALAVAGIWVPQEWWRGLAMAGAALELFLMIGFFAPTKLLPIALNTVVLAAIVKGCFPVKAASEGGSDS